jgi:predicted glycosyltransferase
LYSHDFAGLGHIRRTLAVAGALAARRPDAALVALTSALNVDAYRLPEELDYVRLPSFAKRHVYDGLHATGSVPGMFSGIWAMREALIQETVNTVEPHLVLVDDAPAGPNREFMRALACLRAADPPVQLVLGLADIADDPSRVRALWRAQGLFDLLDTVYDRILIYGDRRVFDTAREYGFSAAAWAKTTYCGYVARAEAAIPVGDIRARLGVEALPLVVVAAGGGTAGEGLLHTYVEALGGPLRGTIASFIVAGPLLPEADWETLRAKAAGLPHTTLERSVADMPSYLNAADLVVTTGGYNAVCEALSLGKRTIIAPIMSRFQEQHLRAERLDALGLARALPATELSAARLTVLIREALDAAPPSIELDFGGVARAGEALADALG